MAPRKRHQLVNLISKQKLTDWQARFILDCLTLDLHLRREIGKQRTKGLIKKLGRRFNVSPHTIRDIERRRTFRWMRIKSIYELSARHRRYAVAAGADHGHDARGT
jgi:hypothetical protein